MFETRHRDDRRGFKAVENPSDIEARDGMATARYIAGMAFSNVGLGLVPQHGAPAERHYDIPHGVANAAVAVRGV
ncbi:MAG: iron-containing alcohol dehydrogenase [Alistipes sp.]